MADVVVTLWRAHGLAISFGAFVVGVVVVAQSLLSASLVAGLACAACVAVAAMRREHALHSFAALISCGFLAGAVSASLAIRREGEVPYAALSERHVVAAVVALERPRPTANGASMKVRIARVIAPSGAAGEALRGEVALLEFSHRGSANLLSGRALRVRARVSLPTGPRNDGEPSEHDVLAEQGVSVLLTAPAERDVEIGSAAPGWEAWWARFRAHCAAAIEAHVPALDATVLEGILWGDRSDLPATLRQEFSDTGTVHVLTTAGLHLGIFAALVAWLLSRVPLPRVLRAALVVAAAWGYAALAGLHLPTIRAATMLTAGCIARETGRARSPSAVLAIAALAVALPHPLTVLTPSFAMSFSCVGGIALLSPALTVAGLRESAGMPAIFVELLRTSAAVQIALWPLQALYFNAFTPYAVFANMLVVPLVGVVMAVGALLVCFSALVPPLTAPLANLASWCVAFLIAAVEKFASLPFAHVDVPPPTHGFLMLYWALLAAFAWLMREPGRIVSIARWSVPAAAALVLAYAAPGLAAALDTHLRIDAIDVGQADCILVRAPHMHAMLVDGGGRLERSGAHGDVVAQPLGDVVATRTVMPFLLRHWVLRLDALVLTHPHGDHAGGLPVILQREHVGVLYDSAQLYGGPAYQRALEIVRERRVHYRVARRGESFDLGPQTRVAILAPELPLITGSASDINNNSVVLRVEFGHVAILMTGDAQSEAEARLLSHGSADLRADILKVGHHGSAYSSTPTFLAAVHPKIAIISCGLHNAFGHPSPRTLVALHDAGATIYRTDLDGGMSIISDGVTIQAKSMAGTATEMRGRD